MIENIISTFKQKPAFFEICKKLDNKSLNSFLRTCKGFATWQKVSFENQEVIQQIVLRNLGVFQTFTNCDWGKTFLILKRIRQGTWNGNQCLMP